MSHRTCKDRNEQEENRIKCRKRVRILLIVCGIVGVITVLALLCYFPGEPIRETAAEQQETLMSKEAEETTVPPIESTMEEQNMEQQDQEQEPRPLVKGIYVTGPRAGSDSMDDLIALLDETELNTMVIDVKNDEGKITYEMELAAVTKIGADIRYIRDIQALLQKLKAHGIYTIARIVCFKDPCLAEGRPELALKKPDGTPVTDANGLAWVNPYSPEVWEYLTRIAEKAAEDGFDEIQFDYVRFPVGEDAEAADYGVDREVYPKQRAIGEFLSYAAGRLHARDCIVAADVFGTIIGSETDVDLVGQDYAALSTVVDVLSPMVYPSHYGTGVFGRNVPDAYPYDTVLDALNGSSEELSAVPAKDRAIVRPWLQAFTATWVPGHISYAGEQIRQQIQAVYDAGYEEWILWNAANRYSADGLLAE